MVKLILYAWNQRALYGYGYLDCPVHFNRLEYWTFAVQVKSRSCRLTWYYATIKRVK